jgi:hypothetical protein
MLALAGCKHTDSVAGGGGDPGGNPGGGGGALVHGDTLATTDEYQMVNAYQDSENEGGKPLKADPTTNSSMYAADDGDHSTTASKPSFSIKKNGDGVDVTVNGETVTFTAADVGNTDPEDPQYGWEKTEGDRFVDLYSYNGKKDASDTGYMQVWGYDGSDSDGFTRGYAVVGLETPEEKLADKAEAKATATYKGTARADTLQALDNSEGSRVRGDLTLNADFGAGTVAGSIDNLQARSKGADTNGNWTNWQAAAGKIELGNTAISSTGFSGGAISLDDTAKNTFTTDLSGSTYSGRFYGPDANQVGGVMNIVGTNEEGKKIVGTGFLEGWKQ